MILIDKPKLKFLLAGRAVNIEVSSPKYTKGRVVQRRTTPQPHNLPRRSPHNPDAGERLRASVEALDARQGRVSGGEPGCDPRGLHVEPGSCGP